MSDIVERLRETYPKTYAFTELPHIGHEAADNIESLRQRVKELEERNIEYARTKGELLGMYGDLEAELAALKQQGEPVGEWQTSKFGNYLQLVWNEKYMAKDGEKLYTSAPTIPEGWVMMPKKVSMEMTIAASRKLGECDSGFWTRGGMLESVLIDKIYDELIAAAPKPEEG